jgi:hypothetical protein
MQYPIIADSGANYHMFKNREFFETLHLASGNVFLGDGKTVLAIKGIGTVKCRIGDHILQIEDVRFIPDLAESIYSLFLHIQCPGHGLHSSFEDGLFICFPTFQTKAILGADDVYLDAVPVLQPVLSDIDIPHKSPLNIDPRHTTDVFCRNIKQFQSELSHEKKNLDNLLKNLRRYYKEVKTKRQLCLEVPAGF